MSETTDSGNAMMNNDRELWREPSERPGMEYYAPSIHVTERGGIGISVGGLVIVRTLREWHKLAAAGLPPVPPIGGTTIERTEA